MNSKRILMALIAVSILTLQTVASTPMEHKPQQIRSGWGTMTNAGRQAPAIERAEAAGDTEAQEAAAGADSTDGEAVAISGKNNTQVATEGLVGTWFCRVPDAPGAPGFDAYQTFNDDGTMTETSSLLGTLPEGPAHGVWQRADKKDSYNVTFELFAFDESGNAVGRIRVRVLIRLRGKDNFTADTAVDFIEPSGNVIPEIGVGPYSAARVKVLPVN